MCCPGLRGMFEKQRLTTVSLLKGNDVVGVGRGGVVPPSNTRVNLVQEGAKQVNEMKSLDKQVRSNINKF